MILSINSIEIISIFVNSLRICVWRKSSIKNRRNESQNLFWKLFIKQTDTQIGAPIEVPLVLNKLGWVPAIEIKTYWAQLKIELGLTLALQLNINLKSIIWKSHVPSFTILPSYNAEQMSLFITTEDSNIILFSLYFIILVLFQLITLNKKTFVNWIYYRI